MLLPEKPQYWAEFVDNPSPTTVAVIAMFGWMLVDNQYEQEIYEAAVDLMHHIVAGKVDAKVADYVYGGDEGRYDGKIRWVSQELAG